MFVLSMLAISNTFSLATNIPQEIMLASNVTELLISYL